MPGCVPLFRLLVSCLALALCCHAHHHAHRPSSLRDDEQQQQQMLLQRWNSNIAQDEVDLSPSKMVDQIFGGSDDVVASDRNNRVDNQYSDEMSDASISSDELLEGGGIPVQSKRGRDGGSMGGQGGSRGPTLSVVSPLEVLRQRLRLDRAKQLFRENQRQIVANEALLEKIGKRSIRSRP